MGVVAVVTVAVAVAVMAVVAVVVVVAVVRLQPYYKAFEGPGIGIGESIR